MRAQLIISAGILFMSFAGVFAQESSLTQKEVIRYFERSEKIIGGAPFRNVTVIEMGNTPSGPWKPYSSWTYAAILPDRSHMTYTSGRTGEFIHIGNRSFSKLADGSWTESPDTIKVTITSPSSPFRVFRGPTVTYSEARDGDLLRVTVISAPEANAKAPRDKSLTYMYFFDGTGLLLRQQSIAHNGENWVRRTETYEYDPGIRIEAPIDEF